VIHFDSRGAVELLLVVLLHELLLLYLSFAFQLSSFFVGLIYVYNFNIITLFVAIDASLLPGFFLADFLRILRRLLSVLSVESFHSFQKAILWYIRKLIALTIRHLGSLVHLFEQEFLFFALLGLSVRIY